jgi:hypothetical protein
MMYNTITFYTVVYMIIRVVYHIIGVQTICIRYINNNNKINNFFIKSIFEKYLNINIIIYSLQIYIILLYTQIYFIFMYILYFIFYIL